MKFLGFSFYRDEIRNVPHQMRCSYDQNQNNLLDGKIHHFKIYGTVIHSGHEIARENRSYKSTIYSNSCLICFEDRTLDAFELLGNGASGFMNLESP